MSSETLPTATPPSTDWPPLSVHERRVLGVLVEKAKTTPDAYPMSLNALTTGCNQKSNRDPVLELSDADVEHALASCQRRLLIFKITGGRVDRWKHNLYDAWQLNKVELAVMGELLLRGPQTEGELRGRASRMEPIDDLEALRALLKPLATRRLVVYLTPEGRRGTVLTHGFHSEKELERLRATQPAVEEERPAPIPAAAPVEPEKTAALQDEVAALRTQVTQLQDQVTSLAAQVRELRESLGG
jgi:uncharacterized protein YceH (UPF0502 family)